MSERNIELSVVVLCYRRKKEIIPIVNNLKQILNDLTDKWEIVLVGNYIKGTDDETKEVVQELANSDSRLKAVAKPKEGMMGWDMRQGMTEAAGEYICVIDGDSNSLLCYGG